MGGEAPSSTTSLSIHTHLFLSRVTDGQKSDEQPFVEARPISFYLETSCRDLETVLTLNMASKTKAKEPWGDYQTRHGVYSGNARLSEDGRHWLKVDEKTGDKVIIAKHIQEERGGNARHLVWFGRHYELERISELVNKLKKISEDFWRGNIALYFTELLGKNHEVNLYGFDKERKVVSLTISKYNHGFSYSYGRLGLNSDGLPDFQRPMSPTVEGMKALKLIDRYQDLSFRHRKIQHLFTTFLHRRLNLVADKYEAGQIIQFKLAGKDYMFKKNEPHSSSMWEYIGTRSVNLDILGIKPDIVQ